MTNRIPKYPGRTKMTRQDGSVEYVTLERADEPTQIGTPLNKATLLSDATAEAIGLTSEDPTVDEALGSVFDKTDQVGDIRETTRTYLGDDWALCNGDVFSPDQYPDLAEVTPDFISQYLYNHRIIQTPGVVAASINVGDRIAFVIVNTSTVGVQLGYSDDFLKTINYVTITSSKSIYTHNMRLFYANGYYIMTCSTSDYCYLFYSNDLTSGFTQVNIRPFFSGTMRYVFDCFYEGGIYYLLGAKGASSSSSYVYPVAIKSSTLDFPINSQDTIAVTLYDRNSSGAMYYGVIRTPDKWIFPEVWYSSGQYLYFIVCEAFNFSTPSSERVTILSADKSIAIDVYVGRNAANKIDGNKFYILGRTASKPYKPMLLVANEENILGPWEKLQLSTNYEIPEQNYLNIFKTQPIIKARGKYYLPGSTVYGFSGFLLAADSLDGEWNTVNTSDGSTVAITPSVNGTLNVVGDMVVAGSGESSSSSVPNVAYRLFAAPLYALPTSDTKLTYKYIKVK